MPVLSPGAIGAIGFCFCLVKIDFTYINAKYGITNACKTEWNMLYFFHWYISDIISAYRHSPLLN